MIDQITFYSHKVSCSVCFIYDIISTRISRLPHTVSEYAIDWTLLNNLITKIAIISKAALAFAEAGASPTTYYIDLMNKPEWYFKVNPVGEVAIVKHGLV